MSVNNLLKLGAINLPKVEQAAAWLIKNAPLVESPQLPMWVLRTLVRQNRIARLRRGVYAVPDANGRLRLSPYAVGEVVEPGSIVSFFAALAHWNLTDQTPRRIGVISRYRHSPIEFGPQSIVFLARPRQLKKMQFKMAKIGGRDFRIATPVQALLDSLTYPALSVSPAQLLAVLAYGLASRLFEVAPLRRAAIATASIATARRLGFLLELATGKVDPGLAQLARSSHTYLDFVGPEARSAEVQIPRWLLRTTDTPERLRAAAGVTPSGIEA